MVVFEKKSQCSTTPSMILNMKNITRCDKFIPKLVPYYLVYCTYLCKQTGAASCAAHIPYHILCVSSRLVVVKQSNDIR